MANLFRASKASSGGGGATALTITSMPTKTSYSVDTTLDLTGLAVTATFDGGITADVTSAITTVPADGATLSTVGSQTITVSYGGATTSFTVTVLDLPASLEAATWGQIQDAAYNGTLSQFASVGDTKTITVSGNTLTMKLASINDGTGDAGTYYPTGTADFISLELLPDNHTMNPTATNVGGWNDCGMRTYLNETIYNSLPSDLKSAIAEKGHMRTSGNSSTTLVMAYDKIWLPTSWEMNGGNYFSESSTYNKQYAIFTDNASRIKKKVNSNTAQSWWLSTPATSSSSAFAHVSTSGAATSIASANSETLGLPLCFRVGKSLNDFTWDEIATLTRAEKLSSIAKEGDTKEVTIDGNTYHMQLVSINDGTGTAGTYYPANTADFISVEGIPDQLKMYSQYARTGWNNSSLRTYLNETLYQNLSTVLKNSIIGKTHRRTIGNKSTSLESATDKLWLPTGWEIYGSSYTNGESDTYNKHYSIFSDANSRKKIRIGQQSSGSWWLSSPSTTNSGYFCVVGSSGNITDFEVTADYAFATICFRIG